MKKILLILIVFLLIYPKSYAAIKDNSHCPLKRNFLAQSQSSLSVYEEVKKVLYLHLKHANSCNLEGLKSLYADKYTNSDGFNKTLYFDLIKKTWESYPGIKYKMSIQNIETNENMAIVKVFEQAAATTNSKSGLINQKGLLQSTSNSVYYLEKINNDWLITSDYIISEKTSLRYGEAKNLYTDLIAPFQIPSENSYTVAFKIEAPKDSLIIASIGQEKITYPQLIPEEVFRKLPENNTLERVFKSNDKNLNEYAVASYGITKAEINKASEIKIYITGIGFIMSRINVIPKNEFIKVAENENDN